MRKIVKKRQLFNKRLVLNIILVLFVFMSIGYSTLSTNLNILGNLEVKKYYEHTFYNVLAKEAETGGLARKYTGSHHDSFTEEPSKEIYYWYAKNDNEGSQVLDKNNVIFAGQCFQMIRTTDTGGVKMIYNGEADDGKCLNTRGAHVGYSDLAKNNLASNYYYGDDYTYDSINKVFSISGTTEQATWDATTGPNLIGKYTCKQNSVDATCSTLYLVESYNDATNANVIPLNSNSAYSQFGGLQFNAKSNSLADVGYMYNTRYPSNQKTFYFSETLLQSATLSVEYWYAHNVVWGSPTAYRYNLDSPYQVSDVSEYPNLVGKYTFRNTSQTAVSNSALYITAVNDDTMYYIQFGNESGSTHDLSFYNYTYTYGDSYTDNGNGTYTVNNSSTINRSDWYNNYSNFSGKYVCKNAINDSCSELWYITEATSTKITYILVNNNYKYANGFTYDTNTGNYNLNSDSVSFWNINDSTNKTSLNNHHYTCFNESGVCSTISYIYIFSGSTPYYINITDGKNVEDAVNEMLYDDNINTINSTMKSGIEAWYKHYLLDYDSYIEDTVFCYHRGQNNSGTNGFNPNGGNINTQLLFGGSTGFLCQNITDSFSIYNNKAKLAYKVGLTGSGELNLLHKNIRKSGHQYWMGSAFGYTTTSYVEYMAWDGSIWRNYVHIGLCVRPTISLRPGLMYESGDGSMANPYIVKYD